MNTGKNNRRKKIFLILITLVICVSQITFTKITLAQGWSGLDGGISTGGVEAMTVHNGELYAAGNFISAGGIPVKNIARWTGTAWDSLGNGLNGIVFALASYNGELYAGGTFNIAGGIPANFIARWNGAVWDSLGAGTNDQTNKRALFVYNGELFVSGSFNLAGEIPVNGIAKWNGTSWSAIDGLAGGGPDFAVYNGLLYSGTGMGISSWDGITQNLIVGGGLNAGSTCMAVYNGELYVGGAFTLAGGIPVNFIAKWNGSQWSDVGGGLTVCCNQVKDVNAMTVYNGELYVAGKFSFAGGIPVNNLAKWNGTSWSAVCSGTNVGTAGRIRALQMNDGELYIGGVFTTAGGVAASRIAKYSPAYASVTPAAATICSGSSVTLNANTGNAVSWQWYNNGSPMAGAVASQLSVNTLGSYSVAVTFPGQCSASSSATSSPALVTEGTGPTNISITTSPTAGCQPNTIYVGYGAQSITLTANATGAVSYLWSTGATTQSISVTTAGGYSVTAYDASGCASLQTAETETIINIVDARCGSNKTKITMCHVPNGNPANRQTICIAPSAVAAHLALHSGDCIGDCASTQREIISAEVDENEIILEPNPANSQFSILNIQFSIVRVEVFDVVGQRVLSQQPTANSQKLIIDVSKLQNGIYLVQIVSEHQHVTRKILISR